MNDNIDEVNAQLALKYQKVMQGWLRAIDEEMAITNFGVANDSDTYDTAKAKLNWIISWHILVATDPAVNGGFKLVPIDEEKLSSTEWCKKLEIVVLDPDGWDRNNFESSWSEKITEKEFRSRVDKSTARLIMPKID